MSLRMVVLAAATCALFAGCAQPEPNNAAPIFLDLEPNQGLPFQDVSEAIPSFGGAYFEDGMFVVLVTHAAPEAERRAALRWGEEFSGRSSDPLARPRRLELKEVEYSYAELMDARQSGRHVLGLEGVSLYGIDVLTNQVFVGIVREDLRPAVEAFWRDQGLSLEMLDIVIQPLVEPA